MRPATLCEAALRDAMGHGGNALAEFLDEFYTAPTDAARRAMLADEPAKGADRRNDALLGAIAEYLTKQYRLGTPPAWASDPWRSLPEPWHTTSAPTPGIIEYLTFASPGEFKHRNIFTDDAPLQRARRPRETAGGG